MYEVLSSWDILSSSDGWSPEILSPDLELKFHPIKKSIHIWILLWQIWEYFLNSEKLWHQAWTAPKRFPKIWAQALQKWPVPGWTWAGTRAQPITKSGSTMYIAKCCIMFVYLCMFVKYFDDQQYLQDLKLKVRMNSY